MSSEFLLAIISSSSALIGALIPTWFNYKNNLKQLDQFEIIGYRPLA